VNLWIYLFLDVLRLIICEILFLLHRCGYWRYDPLVGYLRAQRKIVIPAMSNIKMRKDQLVSIQVIQTEGLYDDEDVEKMFVNPVPQKKPDWAMLVGSWMSSIRAGKFIEDALYLAGQQGKPSDVLKRLQKHFTDSELLTYLARDVSTKPSPGGEVSTQFVEPGDKSATEEAKIETINKQAINEVHLEFENDF